MHLCMLFAETWEPCHFVRIHYYWYYYWYYWYIVCVYKCKTFLH